MKMTKPGGLCEDDETRGLCEDDESSEDDETRGARAIDELEKQGARVAHLITAVSSGLQALRQTGDKTGGSPAIPLCLNTP